ncbi:hypothetical protein [Marixanthomonas spongiae]|uniref:Uncharacterized protein n=1 Tax=Marixanthomonas spongiae TaxID=2174845 RepID=A0A2U0I0Y0_9FLAO|nr:hypothetical protein [Marixanthomonas spongiae]PVW14758.1 hypothetical protein DDV96_09595 [Marixanthomonas spongiae]
MIAKNNTATRKKEQEFARLLNVNIPTYVFENASISGKNTIESIIERAEYSKNTFLITNEIKTLVNLIKETDNKFIIQFLIQFLDVSKTNKIHILKTPAPLRESKYKIFFWMLFFCHKNEADFQLGFHKLIAEISNQHPKKTVFEMLNFGVTLYNIKAGKKEFFTAPTPSNTNGKKKLVKV